MAMKLNDGEEILIQCQGNNIKSFMNVQQGTFYLTNQRFIFARASKGVRFWAAPIHGFLEGWDVEFAFPYTEFSALQVAKHGFAKKFVIQTLSGASYNIQVQKKEEWLDVLRQALVQYSGGHVMDDGAGGFYVAR